MNKKLKKIFKLTKAKVVSFIVLTILSQIYTIQAVANPICLGPCGDKVYTFAWQFQTWGWYTIRFSAIFIALILFISFVCYLVKKK